MNFWFYALLRSARQRMTESELEVARTMTRLAEGGEPAALEALRRMMWDVLYDGDREEACAAQASPRTWPAGQL